MKLLSKSSNKAYFLRNDIFQTLHIKKHVTQYSIQLFAEHFFWLYCECVQDQTASVLMMDWHEQQRLYTDYIKHFHVDVVVSLDKLSHKDKNVFISRNYKIVNGTLQRDGYDFQKPFFGDNLANKNILILDDDIYTNGTINFVLEQLEQELSNAKNIYQLGLANICCDEFDMLDCNDLRDFVPQCMFSGLVVIDDVFRNKKQRISYIDPIVDLSKFSSISKDKCDYFINQCQLLINKFLI